MYRFKRLKKAAGLHVEPETRESFIKRFWINLTHRNPVEAKKHREKLKNKRS